MTANVVRAVSSEKAVAGMAGAIGIQFAAPLLANIPGLGNGQPIGRIIAGAIIAWIGVQFLEGYPEAVVVGIGAGLVAQGIAAWAMPQMVRA